MHIIAFCNTPLQLLTWHIILMKREGFGIFY